MQDFKPDKNRKSFETTLAGMAVFSGKTMSKEILNYYCEAIEPHGFENGIEALKQLMFEMKGNNFFSVSDILAKIKPNDFLSDDKKASELASLIISCVQKHGYNNWKKVSEKIGAMGRIVIKRRGGWENFCEILSNDNIRTTEAQIRDEIKALLPLFKTGNLSEEKTYLINENNVVNNALSLVDKSIIKIK